MPPICEDKVCLFIALRAKGIKETSDTAKYS